MDVRTNLNPWVGLQNLTKNLVDNEENRRECGMPERISKDLL